MRSDLTERLKSSIREVPNFPKAGVNFYDITTALKNGVLFADVIDFFKLRYAGQSIDAIVGVEARGFIFAAALAYSMKCSFIPIRKTDKLPAQVIRAGYNTEYSRDTIEMHQDALQKGQRVILIDDVLATGGTAKSSIELIHQLGGVVHEAGFLIELPFLNGRTAISTISSVPVFSLLVY